MTLLCIIIALDGFVAGLLVGLLKWRQPKTRRIVLRRIEHPGWDRDAQFERN